MKPITGQYECVHRSAVGLDYFTSRIDRVTLQANGRFILTVQSQSRLANAAQSLVSGQQVTAAAPEIRREGSYMQQGNNLTLNFDDGGQERGVLNINGEGLQLGPNYFNKVSDSTLLPPTHRMKKDMEDIAKGLKIASTIGGMAVKAVKTLQDTLQPGQQDRQDPQHGQAGQQPYTPPQPAQQGPPAPVNSNQAPPVQHAQPVQPPQPAPQQPSAGGVEALYCDQCGARARPGKRFCSQCGAQLP